MPELFEHISPEELLRLRADPGRTAITIEICPHNPVTVIVANTDLDEMVHEFERTVIAKFDDWSEADYAGLRRNMVDHVVPAIASSDKTQLVNCATVVVWCALNHPRDGGMVRARTTHLRKSGLAPHFTICRGPKGAYSTALGEGYVDLRQHVAERIEPGQTTVIGHA